MRLSTSFLLTLLIGVGLFLFSSCEMFNEREDCDGYVRVVNTIPDTTLAVDGPTYERDLTQKPAIFRHTAERTMSFKIFNSDNFVVKATIQDVDVLTLEPRKQGTVSIEIQASDACDKMASTTFEVAVTE